MAANGNLDLYGIGAIHDTNMAYLSDEQDSLSSASDITLESSYTGPPGHIFPSLTLGALDLLLPSTPVPFINGSFSNRVASVPGDHSEPNTENPPDSFSALGTVAKYLADYQRHEYLAVSMATSWAGVRPGTPSRYRRSPAPSVSTSCFKEAGTHTSESDSDISMRSHHSVFFDRLAWGSGGGWGLLEMSGEAMMLSRSLSIESDVESREFTHLPQTVQHGSGPSSPMAGADGE